MKTTIRIKGKYVMPAIPPWCAEKHCSVQLIFRRGSRVLLRDMEIQSISDYLIETDAENFIQDK